MFVQMVRHYPNNSSIQSITKHFFSLSFDNSISEAGQTSYSSHVVMVASFPNLNYLYIDLKTHDFLMKHYVNTASVEICIPLKTLSNKIWLIMKLKRMSLCSHSKNILILNSCSNFTEIIDCSSNNYCPLFKVFFRIG